MVTGRTMLQRKCACGGTPGLDGECAECKRKRLQRKRAGEARRGPEVAPPIVHDVLRSSGRPLATGVRAEMERRLGHDFSNVRIHTDSRAAESARAVNALAYTVGRHVAFDEGKYTPGTTEGRRLLAHELTHVIQQRGAPAAPGSPIDVSPPGGALEAEADGAADNHRPSVRPPTQVGNRGSLQRAIGPQDALSRARRGETLPYREATEMAECVRIMGPENQAHCEREIMGEEVTPPALPSPVHCEPSRALTWADFQGTAPQSHLGAETFVDHDLVTEAGTEIIKATFQSGRSWVKARVANPTDRSATGCGTWVARCEEHFDNEDALGHTQGVTYTWSVPNASNCPASAAGFPGTTVHGRDECETGIGATCDAHAQRESPRVLHHEQLHFDIACVLARKGTRALAGMTPSQKQRVLQRVRLQARRTNVRYDNQTRHGCLQDKQDEWDQKVANGLPGVTVG